METRARLVDISKDFITNKVRLTFSVDRCQNPEEYMEKDLRLKAVQWREKRSLNANAYFHVLCTKMAEATSMSLTEMKNRLISEYGQPMIDEGHLTELILRDSVDWTKIEGVHLHPTQATKVLDNGQLYRVYLMMRGSHTYDTKEMSLLIDRTVADANDLGIETMTPDELERMKALWKAS